MYSKTQGNVVKEVHRGDSNDEEINALKVEGVEEKQSEPTGFVVIENIQLLSLSFMRVAPCLLLLRTFSTRQILPFDYNSCSHNYSSPENERTNYSRPCLVNQKEPSFRVNFTATTFSVTMSFCNFNFHLVSLFSGSMTAGFCFLIQMRKKSTC